MNKSTITINGELDEVMRVGSVFTHATETKFFNGLGKCEVLYNETGEALNSGFFVSSTSIESEFPVTADNLNALLSEYPDSRVVVVLDTDAGQWIAASDGAVAL